MTTYDVYEIDVTTSVTSTNLRPHIERLQHKVDFAYYAADARLNTVTDNTGAAKAFTYNYEAANYGLINTIAGPVHTVDNDYETNRNILTNKKNEDTVGSNIRSSYLYATNELGQRTNVTRGGVEMSAANGIKWTYNTNGELKEEDYGNNATADTRDRVFNYDAIGNRKERAEGTLTLTGTANYTVNNLNQYQSTPSLPSALTYDLDGNAESYPVPKSDNGTAATLTWDAENRLLTATVTIGGVNVTTSYEYDYIGRRIGKTTVGSPSTTDTYIYHGWNLCAEYTGTTLKKTYTWGMDLSGSMQGAGGVGGLLMVTEHSGGNASHYYPTYDGNGNVSEYLKSDGTSVAHYEYDAFGNEITTATSGSKSADFAHRFSTKYLDKETGLYYYGYRYYDAAVGRWINRDPIGEKGGFNLYGYTNNNGISGVDILGLMPPGGVDFDFRPPTIWDDTLFDFDPLAREIEDALDDLPGIIDEAIMERLRTRWEAAQSQLEGLFELYNALSELSNVESKFDYWLFREFGVGGGPHKLGPCSPSENGVEKAGASTTLTKTIQLHKGRRIGVGVFAGKGFWKKGIGIETSYTNLRAEASIDIGTKVKCCCKDGKWNWWLSGVEVTDATVEAKFDYSVDLLHLKKAMIGGRRTVKRGKIIKNLRSGTRSIYTKKMTSLIGKGFTYPTPCKTATSPTSP